MNGDRPVVLIVDRNPMARGIVGAWLEDAGLEVVSCPGPTTPEFTCIGSRNGHCPLARVADVVVLNAWLESDAAMAGARAPKLIDQYRAWSKYVVVMTNRHDAVAERIGDLSLPTVEWPPDRRELIETIGVVGRERVPGPGSRRSMGGEPDAACRPSAGRVR